MAFTFAMKTSKIRGARIELDMRGRCIMTRDEMVQRNLDLLNGFMQVAFEGLGILDHINLDTECNRNDWLIQLHSLKLILSLPQSDPSDLLYMRVQWLASS